MSANGPPADLVVPPGFTAPGMRGDAAPDSVLAQLRRDVQTRREAKTVTLEWTLGASRLRATYGVLDVDQTEQYVTGAQVDPTKPLSANLEVLARSCRSIEVLGDDGEWGVLEDAAGPVTFDDRLTRLLGWERPGDEFRYPVREVYATMFGHDGFAVLSHFTQAATALGLVDAEAVGMDLSTGGSPMRSGPLSRSG